jgi:electron transfer flavoprotein beta subunit
MKVVVLAKTASGAAIDRDDAFWRAGRILPGALGAFDAHAAEAALRLCECGLATEIVVVAIAASSEVLGGVREVLAMGADRALLLCDPLVEQADIAGRGKLLAALLAREDAELYLACPWNGDIDSTLMLAAAAARMGMPFLSQARRLEIGGKGIVIERQTDSGDATLPAELPCLVEVTESINKPRYPTMKGKQEAKRKPLALITVAELGLEDVIMAHTRVRGTAAPEPRTAPIVVEDGDNAPERIIAFLEDRRLLA